MAVLRQNHLGQDNLEGLLRGIIANSQAHGQFLATLSHLEYVGARKIAKSLPADRTEACHLEHLMEESRHATLLKRQAELLLGDDAATKSWGKRAENYLQVVDHGIAACLRAKAGTYRPFENYLLTALIIEERAMVFYPLYLDLLPEGSIRATIQSILRDEVGHLEDMQRVCRKELKSFDDLLESAREIEIQAYQQFFWPILKHFSEQDGLEGLAPGLKPTQLTDKKEIQSH